MDQLAVLEGTAGHAVWIDTSATPHPTKPVALGWEADGLVLAVIATGAHHALADGEYAARREECERAAAELGIEWLASAGIDATVRLADETLKARTRHVLTETARVRGAVNAIGRRAWEQLGTILTASHASLRDDFQVSCPELDVAVEAALEAGALGARMTGGGFGGSVIALDRARAGADAPRPGGGPLRGPPVGRAPRCSSSMPPTAHTRCQTSQVTSRRIAYQGEPGANSDMVCKQHYPDRETLPCASFEDVFAAVNGGEAELAMIPIDNSIAGRVADIHHFLPTSGLHIIAEHFLRIQFSLLGVRGATIDQIKTVHSHVHALGQCRKIIKEHGLTTVISGDTAGAAREIADAGDPTQAAISPPLAAEIYGLDVLATDIEDEDHNTTRFVVLSRDAQPAPRGQRAGRHELRLQRAQPAGGALQGARRFRDQRRQHDQARELHGRRRVRRDPVPGRGRRAPGRPGARAGARGARRSSPPT